MIKDALIDLLGEYEPVTYDVTDYYLQFETSSDESNDWECYGASSYVFDSVVNTYVSDGSAGVNWSWVGSAFLVIILLFCFCRMIGGMLNVR